MNIMSALSIMASLTTPVGAWGSAQCATIVDVTIVATDTERLLQHRTIIVRQGHIESISTAGAHAPRPHCLVIDGRGRYLIPGLTDTHVHFFGYSKVDAGDPETEI